MHAYTSDHWVDKKLRHPAHNGPSGRHRQCWMGKQVSVREVRGVGRVDLQAQRLPRASGERGRPGPVPGCHQQAARCPLDMPTTGGAQTREQPKHRPVDDTELGKRHTRPQRHSLEEQPRRTLVLLARTSQHVRRVIAGNPSDLPHLCQHPAHICHGVADRRLDVQLPRPRGHHGQPQHALAPGKPRRLRKAVREVWRTRR
mmetsp:Transcript_16642/g.46059  ORF Transcript_16642/g.46059 Transcript_16642/m.46059 type:complete len:201 (+) Transcript_16642:2-604(+)